MTLSFVRYQSDVILTQMRLNTCCKMGCLHPPIFNFLCFSQHFYHLLNYMCQKKNYSFSHLTTLKLIEAMKLKWLLPTPCMSMVFSVQIFSPHNNNWIIKKKTLKLTEALDVPNKLLRLQYTYMEQPTIFMVILQNLHFLVGMVSTQS